MGNKSDTWVGGARALLGQGLAMGWGDEAEALARSKLPGGGTYEQELAKITRENARFAREHPVAQPALEFTGGVLPAVASYFATAGTGGAAAPTAAATTARSAGALTRLATNPAVRGFLTGATQGAISGSGSARPGERTSGATTGAIIGGGVGAAVPLLVRGTTAGARWLRERVAPTEAVVQERAAGKLNRALKESKKGPQNVKTVMAKDRSMNVPSRVANVDEATADLAEAVAQRSGASARNVQAGLRSQQAGARERTVARTNEALSTKNYHDDLADITKNLSTKAAPLYKKAYEFGEVNDPRILEYLKLPQFQEGLKAAQKLLAAEGRQLDMSKPTVEVLDQVKRGIDTLIDAQTDATTGKMTALGRVYKNKKNEFLNLLDEVVPDYKAARQVYAGDAAIADALRAGRKDFGKLDHEQVIALVSKMSPGEKEAFRTGVVRDLYGRVMNPQQNINAAGRIIGSPEMQAKLQPLFDSPEQFNLFRAAMERESQLYQQSSRILGGSPTAKRKQMAALLEEGGGAGQFAGDLITGGFSNGLSNMVLRVIRSGQMTDDVAEKLSKMLMAKDPHEVAAVVKMLEDQAAGAVNREAKLKATEMGVRGGTLSSFWPAPADESAPPANLETDINAAPPVSGPDITADIGTSVPATAIESEPMPTPTIAEPTAPVKIEGPDIEADILEMNKNNQ